MRLIRVFPRKTKATPDDDLAYFGPPAPVKVGGVAYGDRGEDFIPGRYIKPGYVFTSRGCPRRCWFCSVWKRDPEPRLLPIIDGWNVLDDNLLACPRGHMFWAYDPGDKFETLEHAARRLLAAGFTAASHRMRVYVLIGYPKDTIAAAEQRLQQMRSIGMTPMAMLWRPETASQEKYMPTPEWRAYQRRWARPAIIHAAA